MSDDILADDYKPPASTSFATASLYLLDGPDDMTVRHASSGTVHANFGALVGGICFGGPSSAATICLKLLAEVLPHLNLDEMACTRSSLSSLLVRSDALLDELEAFTEMHLRSLAKEEEA